jgi:uncharacterized protein (DUF1015 family)
VTNIIPLRAFIYNREKIKDISTVVCPPYDVISAQQQQYYHDRNPYNLIHILLGIDLPGEDKYTRASYYFRDWIKNKILIQIDLPAIYFYVQQYNIRGENRTRLGFISLLRLQDKNPTVFGHEHTRLEPKVDRLKLLKHVKGNLSPIFVILEDKKRVIQRIYRKDILGKKPFIDIIDDEKVAHKLWRIESQESLDLIQAGTLEENIFIADGHHRYEVACAYRDEMKQKLQDRFTGQEGFNYILTYFTNTDPRGLTILPVHRLLKVGPRFDFQDFKDKLTEHFDLEEIKDKNRFFFLMERAGRTENVFGIYKDKKYLLLRLKNIKILDKAINDKPKEYRTLDISILNYLVLKKILGIDLEDKENLKFSSFAQDFITEVDNDNLKIAFFLNPVKISQIISVALKGERMPSKSTYFYPKVLSGLLINKLD